MGLRKSVLRVFCATFFLQGEPEVVEKIRIIRIQRCRPGERVRGLGVTVEIVENSA